MRAAFISPILIFFLRFCCSSDVATLLALSLIFTVFELLGDILKNQVSPYIVAEYLLNVTPYFLYNVAQYGVLLAVLITLGLMERSNEVTALKATGISVYRVIIPVLLVEVMVEGGFFLSVLYSLRYCD